jgi:hypothetical protein
VSVVLVTLNGGPADMMRVALESPRSTVVVHDADDGTEYRYRYVEQRMPDDGSLRYELEDVTE